MSTEARNGPRTGGRADERTDERSGERGGPPAGARLGHLLKHAYLAYTEAARAVLEPYGIDGRELAVLDFLGGPESPSQREVARRFGIDRTTMVALIDALERKGLVERRPDPADRRRNVVEPTASGRETLAGAIRAADEAERRFLAPLGPAEAERFKNALRALLSTPPR